MLGKRREELERQSLPILSRNQVLQRSKRSRLLDLAEPPELSEHSSQISGHSEQQALSDIDVGQVSEVAYPRGPDVGRVSEVSHPRRLDVDQASEASHPRRSSPFVQTRSNTPGVSLQHSITPSRALLSEPNPRQEEQTASG